MTNLGKWNPWYSTLPADSTPAAYGTSDAYRIGAQWLAPCPLVEDWGCGLGWMRHHIPTDRYRGIDGTASPFADHVADLATYQSVVSGVYMRGVIEHDWNWETILANAVTSFTDRMVLALFTPMSNDLTKEIGRTKALDVPDISFTHDDIVSHIDAAAGGKLADLIWFDIESDTAFKQERIFLLSKEPAAVAARKPGRPKKLEVAA